MKIITSDILGANDTEITVPVLGVLCGHRINKLTIDAEDALKIYKAMYSDSGVERRKAKDWLNHLFSKFV